jgi:hypothetical protein
MQKFIIHRGSGTFMAMDECEVATVDPEMAPIEDATEASDIVEMAFSVTPVPARDAVRLVLEPGGRIVINLDETDGCFLVDYDSKGDGTLMVVADIEDADGREGVIYCEEFGTIDEDPPKSRRKSRRKRGEHELHTIQVDLPDVLTDGGKLLTTMKEYNLWFMLEAAFGPGGGNPCCNLRGKVKDLRRWLRTVYMDPEEQGVDEEVEFYLWG